MAYENKTQSRERPQFQGAVVQSRKAPDMATKNRGSIMPQAPGNIDRTGRHRSGRNSFIEPEDFTEGPNMGVGVGSSEARNNWQGGFDGYEEDGLYPGG